MILRCSSKGILIDTNLLILLLVGNFDPKYIASFKRTQKYDVSSYAFLKKYVQNFSKIITTPQILTELSNLTFDEMNQSNKMTEYFRQVVGYLRLAQESYQDKTQLIAHPSLSKFGFTDIGIVNVSKQTKCLVITDDFPLSRILETEKCHFINLYHLYGRI